MPRRKVVGRLGALKGEREITPRSSLGSGGDRVNASTIILSNCIASVWIWLVHVKSLFFVIELNGCLDERWEEAWGLQGKKEKSPPDLP